MGVPAEKRRATIDEYLKYEEQALDRHEFHDGDILAMSGGSYRHSIITMNFGATLHRLLKGKPCRALESNMRVRIASQSSYVYPDVSVVCDGPVFDLDDPKQTTIINPRLVVEVLSESTESYDRSAKFNLYRAVESLQEYVLVSQRQPLVETFLRQADGNWTFTPFDGLESIALLRSLQIGVAMADVYAGVDFDSTTTSVSES